MMHYILLVLFLSFIQTTHADVLFSFIGNQIKAGSKHSWVQDVASTSMPITVIHGQYPGPVLTLTAGIHGDEFPAIFALHKLRQEIKPERLRGTLIVVHLANLEGFHARRVALSPVDEKNLNRVFPGRKDGTLTEQIAFFMTHQIIAKTDYLIDIHSGSWNQTLLPHVYSPVMDNASLDKKTLALAKSLGIPHIVLYDERPRDPENAISYPNTAQTRGKPGLTLEVGHLGQSEELDVNLIYQACLNAMSHLGMHESSEYPMENVVIYRKLVSVQSTETGIFHPQIKVGEHVEKDQKIGWVSDYFGNLIATLRSPSAGTVLMQKETPPIRKGETTTDIGLSD
ncbi:MAG: M14 family metallopeptidase [Methylotenera sp.]|nr:M14 family metallopeptidase [Methylotenera sp.]MDP2102515.1 M14 family metallopeptidase [Methylotenera sp.]MDP2280220.1 M14 family metallopeptidase [Methylotenera sp.]MDP2402627.1 M14 family metallopeptidase [Methylotenera sp.]MDP3059204.1 M14 family metallopeptidase [Methylotenera sp.]